MTKLSSTGQGVLGKISLPEDGQKEDGGAGWNGTMYVFERGDVVSSIVDVHCSFERTD